MYSLEQESSSQVSQAPTGRAQQYAQRAKRQRRRRRVLFSLGVILLVGLIVAAVKVVRNGRSAFPNLQTTTAFRTDLVETISASGSVTPQTGARVNIGSQVTGVIKHLYADVGSHVAKGQVIAELDLPDITAQTRQAEATLAQTRESLLQQSTNATMAGLQNANALSVAQENLRSAELKQDQAVKLLSAQRTQTATDIRKSRSAVASALISEKQAHDAYDLQVGVAQAAVNQAQANVDNSSAQLARQEHLLAQGFVAQSTVDADRAQAGVDSAALASAQQNLILARTNAQAAIHTSHELTVQARAALEAAQSEVLQNTVKAEDVGAAESAVRQAEDQLASARAGLMATVAQRHVVAQQRAAVQAQADNVAYSEAQLRKTLITSPISGTVLNVEAQQGETVAAGLNAPTLITVADLNRLQINASVDETDIGKVRIGQDATVTVDAFPDHPFIGHVSKIDAGSTIQQNVVTYAVTIGITDRLHLLKPDMTATVVITVGRHRNVLVVPDEAIKPDGMKSVVGLVRAGAKDPIKREVVTGATDGTDTEIISGLKTGDKVALAGWTPPADKGKVNATVGN